MGTTTSAATTTTTTSLTPATTTTTTTTTTSALAIGSTISPLDDLEVTERGGTCPNVGDRVYTQPPRLNRVMIREPVTSIHLGGAVVVPGSGGTVEVVAEVRLDEWAEFIGTDLPADFGIFDLEPEFAITGENQSGITTVPTTMYCFADDADIDNPLRGYVKATLPWGGGLGAWTGITAVMGSPGVTINGVNRPSYGADRLTIVGKDYTLQPGQTFPGVAGVRLDETLFATITDRIEERSTQVLTAIVRDVVSEDEDLKKNKGSVTYAKADNLDFDLSFSSAGDRGEIHVSATLTEPRIKIHIADTVNSWPCNNKSFDLVYSFDSIHVDFDLQVTGPDGQIHIDVEDPVVDYSNGEANAYGLGGFCDFLFETFKDNKKLKKITGKLKDLRKAFDTGTAEDEINGVLDKLRDDIGLKLDRFDVMGEGLVAKFDGVVPATAGIVIDPRGAGLATLDDAMSETTVAGQSVQAAVYLAPEALSLLSAQALDHTMTTTTDNGAPVQFRFDVAPYAVRDGAGMRFTIPGAIVTLFPPAGAPFPGPHNITVTDYRGFGGFHIEWNAATGKFEIVFENDAANCTNTCPSITLWDTTDPILIPLGHAPHAVGGSFYTGLKERITGLIDVYGTLPYDVALEIAPLTGAGIGANALGFFAVYFNIRPTAHLAVSWLPSSSSPLPYASGVWNFAGGWSYTTSDFSGPVTVTATASNCTHNTPNFVYGNGTVTYAVNIYMPGGGFASCNVTLKAVDTTGRQVTWSTQLSFSH